jgi:hypothetical protein
MAVATTGRLAFFKKHLMVGAKSGKGNGWVMGTGHGEKLFCLPAYLQIY